METGCKHSNAWLPIEAQYNIILDMLKHKITHKWVVRFANNTPFLFHMSFKTNSQTSFEQANGWSFWDWKQSDYNKRYFKSDSLHLYVCTFSHIQMRNHLSLYGVWNSYFMVEVKFVICQSSKQTVTFTSTNRMHGITIWALLMHLYHFIASSLHVHLAFKSYFSCFLCSWLIMFKDLLDLKIGIKVTLCTWHYIHL